MRKLCVIYNIFEGHGRKNIPYYLDAFKSLIYQTAHDPQEYKLAVSGCKVTQDTKNCLAGEFAFATHNYIDELYPVNITFNHTVSKMRERYGEFEAYVYVDSGVNFWNLQHGMACLYDTFKSKDYGIVCADPSNDKGYEYWGAQFMPGPIVEIPLGKAMNAHCNLYSGELVKAYGRVLPDIFASDTSESVHSFMCAALRKKMAIDKRVSVFHNHNMDGGSAYREENRPFLFATTRKMEEICEEGKPYGLGWEECDPKRGLMHDASKYDSEGLSIEPKLKDFIKDNLFLRPSEFDYSLIKSQFLGGN